jgi:hypothetical protein
MTPPDEIVRSAAASPTFPLLCSASASTRAGGLEDGWMRSVGELVSMHCSRQNRMLRGVIKRLKELGDRTARLGRALVLPGSKAQCQHACAVP